ncbi:MAG: hypothetical protein HC915_02570 [Anaerolineae bacterium]|nr:hypothetical protein [Anaerolineae bacterium]
MSNEIELFWAELLSRAAPRIRAAFATLAADERESVLLHLQRMATEAGWAEPQRASAEAALAALTSASSDMKDLRHLEIYSMGVTLMTRGLVSATLGIVITSM